MKTSKSFYVSVVIAVSMFYNIAYAQSHWTPQATSLPDTVIPALVSAVDENTAWAAGIALWYSFPSQSFIKTTDGGATWIAGTIPGVPNFSYGSIYALDGSVAWVTMFDHTNATTGGVFKTTDGGATWVQQTTAFPGSGNYITCVYFFDAANGVCIGNVRDGYFELYTTSDGGDNWTRVLSGNIPNPYSGEHGLVSNFAASGENTLWFGTNKGRVFRTTDRGMTWDAYNAGLGTNMIGVAFQNQTHGLAIALLTSTIMAAKTTDGGMTWTPLTKLPPIAGLISYVPGTSSSYVMGSLFGTEESQPGSAYTNDGGENWTLVDNLGHGAVSFVNPSTGWSGNIESNAIYKWSGPPLPVELVSFTAKSELGKVILNWTTSTETNNLGFEIERRIFKDQNKTEWVRIGFVKGNGTTTESQSYQFIDDIAYLKAKSLSYRLKQIDYDGSYEYSDEVLIANPAPLDYALNQNYPNPFNPVTTIKYSLPIESQVTLDVFNTVGEQVKSLVRGVKEAGSYSVNFEATNLPSGIYIYRLQASEFVETKKMILLR